MLLLWAPVILDVLDIITPPATHAAAIRQAVQHRVATVICQKPFCTSLSEAQEISRFAQESGLRLVVHENFRFQPWFRCAARALAENRIGKVHQASFRMRTGDGQGINAYMDRQPYFQSMRRLLIHETGVHYLDTFRYLFGKPNAVYADLRKRNPVIAGEDAGIVVIDFENQVQAILDGNRHLDFAAENTRLTFGEAIIEGSKGSLQLYGDGRLMQRSFGKRSMTTLLPPNNWPGFAGDCVCAFQQHVVDHLLHDGVLENTAPEYLHTLELVELVYQSSSEGRKLSVS